MPIDLYFNPLSPPSRAVLATAKHLNLDVNIHQINLLAGETQTPEFLKLNPAHTIPVLVDDDGFVLFESRAILQYLANKYPNGASLYPAEPKARAYVDRGLFFDGTTYYPSLYTGVMVPMLIEKQEPPQEALTKLQDNLKLFETIMGESNFLAGDQCSIADISIAATVPLLQLVGPECYSLKMQIWYDRVCAAVPEIKELNDQADYSWIVNKTD